MSAHHVHVHEREEGCIELLWRQFFSFTIMLITVQAIFLKYFDSRNFIWCFDSTLTLFVFVCRPEVIVPNYKEKDIIFFILDKCILSMLSTHCMKFALNSIWYWCELNAPFSVALSTGPSKTA